MMQTITYEEQQLMSIYGHGTRLELIATLNDMRTYLDQDEQEQRFFHGSSSGKRYRKHGRASRAGEVQHNRLCFLVQTGKMGYHGTVTPKSATGAPCL